jgi:hypothetical protein
VEIIDQHDELVDACINEQLVEGVAKLGDFFGYVLSLSLGSED